MIGDDRLERLRLLLFVRCSDLGARHVADNGKQHLAVAKLIEEGPVGMPVPAHIRAEMESDRLDREASRLQCLAHHDRNDFHHDGIGKLEQARENAGEAGPVVARTRHGRRLGIEAEDAKHRAPLRIEDDLGAASFDALGDILLRRALALDIDAVMVRARDDMRDHRTQRDAAMARQIGANGGVAVQVDIGVHRRCNLGADRL